MKATSNKPFNILEHDQKCQEQGAVQQETTRVVKTSLVSLDIYSVGSARWMSVAVWLTNYEGAGMTLYLYRSEQW